MFRRERTIEAHFQHAHFFAARQQFIHHFFTGADRRTHNNDNAFRLRVAVIFKRLIAAAGGIGEIIHRLFNVIVDRVVPRVGGFTRLEVSIRVCGGTANNRMFRVQGAGAVGGDLLLRQQAADRIVGQRHDFVNLMRRAEPVEEVNKRHAALERRNMRDQRKVLRFLHATGAQHGAAGLAHRHDVGMVAKNRQRMGRDGARRDVQHKGRQLPGQFIQRGDHQQETLR